MSFLGNNNKSNISSSNQFLGLFANNPNINNENKENSKSGGLFDFNDNNAGPSLFSLGNNNNSLFGKDNKSPNLFGNLNSENNSLFTYLPKDGSIFGSNNNNNDIFFQKKANKKIVEDKDNKKENNFQSISIFKNMNINNSKNENSKTFNSLNLNKELSFGNKEENNFQNSEFNNNDNNNIFLENSNNNIIDSNINNESNKGINQNQMNFNGHNDNDNDKDNNNNNNEIEVEEDIGDKKEKEIGKIIKMSEELNKPDELNSDSNNTDYIELINQKIGKYKRELDSKVDKIEVNKTELIEQEKKFNNFIEAINTSNKIINYIKDNLYNNIRALEDISSNEDKIINDLDEIEKNLNQRIKDNNNKDLIIKENEEKNKKIENTFNDIEKKIKICHEIMKRKNNVIENKEIKTMNQLLNNIHYKIKKDIQGRQIDYINNIFETEKKYISDK